MDYASLLHPISNFPHLNPVCWESSTWCESLFYNVLPHETFYSKERQYQVSQELIKTQVVYLEIEAVSVNTYIPFYYYHYKRQLRFNKNKHAFSRLLFTLTSMKSGWPKAMSSEYACISSTFQAFTRVSLYTVLCLWMDTEIGEASYYKNVLL